MKMDSEIITMIVKCVLAVVSVILTGYVIPYIKASTDAKKWADIWDFCQKCVEAAEKKFTPEEWREKKLYVMTLVANQLNKMGIEFTADEIDALVEGFVKEIKG